MTISTIIGITINMLKMPHVQAGPLGRDPELEQWGVRLPGSARRAIRLPKWQPADRDVALLSPPLDSDRTPGIRRNTSAAFVALAFAICPAPSVLTDTLLVAMAPLADEDHADHATRVDHARPHVEVFGIDA